MAPELHKGQLFQKGKTSDVWALGLILLEMMVGCAVWDLGVDFGIKALEEPHYICEYINDQVPEKYNPKLK
jgi:serine/threonine protein kinase